VDRDKEIKLKPLPKPVYRPPSNSREAGGRDSDARAGKRYDGRPAGSGRAPEQSGGRGSRGGARYANPEKRDVQQPIPDDFPMVPRKVRPTAARDTYSASAAGRGVSRKKLRMNRKRREAINITTKAPRKINQNALFWGIAALAFCVFIFVIVWGFTKKNAYEIFVNDESVGKVMMSKTVGADSVLTAATARLKEENGADVRINETVGAEPVHVSKNGALGFDKIVAEVESRLTYDVLASAIYVNGEMKGVLKDEKTADAALDKVKAQYRQAGLNIISEGFVEDVRVEPEYVGKDRIQSADDVFAILTSTSSKQDIYTLVEGDSLEKVAKKYGMTVDDLLHANPGITVDTKLKIGQQLNITTPSPVVSVQTVEEVTMTEVDPMPVREQINPDEPATYKKIIQQGADGQKDVTYRITRINGYKQAPVPVNTVVTKAPVAQIEEIGSK